MSQVIDGIRTNNNNQTEQQIYESALDSIYSGQAQEEYHDHQTVPVYVQITPED